MQLGQSRTLPVEKPEQIDLAQAARYFGARERLTALPSPFWKSALRPFSPPLRPGPSGSRPTWRASRRPVF